MSEYRLRTDYDTYEVVLEKDGEEIIRGRRSDINQLISDLETQIADSKHPERSDKLRAAAGTAPKSEGSSDGE